MPFSKKQNSSNNNNNCNDVSYSDDCAISVRSETTEFTYNSNNNSNTSNSSNNFINHNSASNYNSNLSNQYDNYDYCDENTGITTSYTTSNISGNSYQYNYDSNTGKYNTLPKCLSYHPSSELINKSGYYPNINSQQLQAASDLIELIESEGLLFNHDEEDEFLKLLRFLRARKFNVKNAFAMIKEDVRWRHENNRFNLRKETVQDVLKCDLHAIYNYFPTWIQGYDKQRRPVSYRQFGKFEVWNVLKLTTMERLVRFHAWETEQALRLMYKESATGGYNIETFMLVTDAAQWSTKLATNDAFAFIKGMATTDSDHYPERLGTLLVINAPTMLWWAWKICQGFVDNATKQKIKILPQDKDLCLNAMLEFIDIDQIPKQYGGSAPDPTPEDALDSMNPNPLFSKTKSSINIKNKTGVEKKDMSIQTDDSLFFESEELVPVECTCNIM